jgi:hypothetical protein
MEEVAEKHRPYFGETAEIGDEWRILRRARRRGLGARAGG